MSTSLPFDWVVLNPVFDTFDWNIVDFSFGDDLRVVLDDVLDCVVVGVAPLNRNLFNSFSIFVLNDFPLVWDVLSPLHWLVFNYGLFVGHILNPAFTWVSS